MSGPFPALLLGLTACFAASCSSPSAVGLGMSTEDVVRRLGEPDRRAVLVGKLLQDPQEVSAEQADRYRSVFIYEASGVQVWFFEGQVTGMTEHGVAVELGPAPSQTRDQP